MYFIELTHRFWDFNKKNPVGSTAISMYLYLLKIAFDNERYDFQISDVAVSKELGLTRKTVKSTKEKLKNFGLIEFQTKNGLPCYYRLLLDYPFKICETEKIEKVKIENNSISQKSENLEIQLYKITEIENVSKSSNSEFEINLSQIMQTSINQDAAPKIIPQNIPSIEEFIEYAQTLEIYDAELDFEIQSKYESWKNNGWKNHADRPITNWKSSLKSILPYIKNKNNDYQLSSQNIPSIKRPRPLHKK